MNSFGAISTLVSEITPGRELYALAIVPVMGGVQTPYSWPVQCVQMQKSEAEQVVPYVLEGDTAIGSMGRAVSSLESDNERHRLAAAIGDVLRVTRERILLPIFRDFPDLCPDEMK